jgi:hypothetical protein
MPGLAASIGADGHFRGSAFIITPTLALTASFIVYDRADGSPFKDLKIKPLSSGLMHGCKVIWSDETRNIALVSIDQPLHEAELALGEFIGPGSRSCETTLYRDSLSEHDKTTAWRINGTIDPATLPEEEYFIFRAHASLSNWRGSGGAGICYQDFLIGIITKAWPDENSFGVVPLATILKDGDFSKLLEQSTGQTPKAVPFSPPEGEISDAIDDVSKADPTNIHEVAAAQFKLSNLYYENVLNQARRSFNAAIIAAVVGLAFFLGSVAFSVVSRELSTSVISLVGGSIVETIAGLNFWLYGRTSSQLNYFHLRLERTQRFLIANSVAASLAGKFRERALAELIKTLTTPETAISNRPPTRGPGIGD